MKSRKTALCLSSWRMPDELLPQTQPDRKVWTLRIDGGDCDGLIAEVAWFEESGTREHHWITQGPLDPNEESISVVEMTVSEFLNRKWSGMNPFFTLARHEALAKWRDYWRAEHDCH